jgi:phage tail-like protein
MANRPFNEMFRVYNFKLAFQPNIVDAHFFECSNLTVNVPAIKYREGGMQQVVHSLPGYVEYGDVTLRYGLSTSRELFDWFLTAVSGRVQRRNVSILLLDNSGSEEVMRWDLIGAWATQWKGTVLNAMQQEVAIESLTLVYETLQRA